MQKKLTETIRNSADEIRTIKFQDIQRLFGTENNQNIFARWITARYHEGAKWFTLGKTLYIIE